MLSMMEGNKSSSYSSSSTPSPGDDGDDQIEIDSTFLRKKAQLALENSLMQPQSSSEFTSSGTNSNSNSNSNDRGNHTASSTTTDNQNADGSGSRKRGRSSDSSPTESMGSSPCGGEEKTAPAAASTKAKRPHKKRKKSSPILQRTNLDILCGRGMPIHTYSGNILLHEIVNTRRPVYNSVSRQNKPKIIKEIVQEVKAGGGRFLRRTTGGGTEAWEEMDDEFAYQKVAHALRNRKYKSQELAMRQYAAGEEGGGSEDDEDFLGDGTGSVDYQDHPHHPPHQQSGQDTIQQQLQEFMQAAAGGASLAQQGPAQGMAAMPNGHNFFAALAQQAGNGVVSGGPSILSHPLLPALSAAALHSAHFSRMNQNNCMPFQQATGTSTTQQQQAQLLAFLLSAISPGAQNTAGGGNSSFPQAQLLQALATGSLASLLGGNNIVPPSSSSSGSASSLSNTMGVASLLPSNMALLTYGNQNMQHGAGEQQPQHQTILEQLLPNNQQQQPVHHERAASGNKNMAGATNVPAGNQEWLFHQLNQMIQQRNDVSEGSSQAVSSSDLSASPPSSLPASLQALPPYPQLGGAEHQPPTVAYPAQHQQAQHQARIGGHTMQPSILEALVQGLLQGRGGAPPQQQQQHGDSTSSSNVESSCAAEGNEEDS